MSCNYIVTAYKPTAVTKAVVGNFTSPTDLNLIQAKGSSIVVTLVTPEGLKPMLEASIYGRISIMQLMRPKVHCSQLYTQAHPYHYMHCVTVIYPGPPISLYALCYFVCRGSPRPTHITICTVLLCM